MKLDQSFYITLFIYLYTIIIVNYILYFTNHDIGYYSSTNCFLSLGLFLAFTTIFGVGDSYYDILLLN